MRKAACRLLVLAAAVALSACVSLPLTGTRALAAQGSAGALASGASGRDVPPAAEAAPGGSSAAEGRVAERVEPVARLDQLDADGDGPVAGARKVAPDAEAAPVAVLAAEDARMFWSIRGRDAAGNASTVYILGTIHVGDGRLYPVDDAVRAAWEGADRLVAEMSAGDMASVQEAVQALMAESRTERNVAELLTDEQLATLYRFMEPEEVAAVSAFEPWVATYSLAGAAYAGSGLESQRGLDGWFAEAAAAAGRTVEGLDSLQAQLDIVRFGSYEEQLAMLRDTLDTLADPALAVQGLLELYEAYLADDRDAVGRLTARGVEADESEHAFYADYYRLVYDDRNAAWADKIRAYLEEGGTTFIFAGCGHFTGEASVFLYLRQNGTL